jgi:prolyl-tRNA editing enzyme YbaK/EbsC (Cys-tRNA(Pro) deacylase)
MTIESVIKNLNEIAPDLIVLKHNKDTATAEEAAKVHNVYIGQIVKTMALIIDEPILIMMAGDMKLDNKKYKIFFKKKAKMLNSEETLLITSHPVGGVSPFGLPNKLRIYTDISLDRYQNVIPAAGSRKSSVVIDRERLINLLGAEIIDISVKK